MYKRQQIALAEKEVNSCDQEEPFLLQAEIENEPEEVVPMSKTAKEINGKLTMGA